MTSNDRADRPFDAVPADLATVLDPAWLSLALDDVGPGERVVAATVIGSSKTLAQKVRFTATIEARHGTTRDVDCCVKAHFDDRPGTLMTEAHVYRDLLPHAGVRSPRAHYTGIDDAHRRAMIIMDDLDADGATFLNAFDPYSVSLARDSLSQLARLHASTWGQSRWQDTTWLGSSMDWMPSMFSTDALQALLDDGRGPDLAPSVRDAAALQRALQHNAQLPGTCVIHGDTHSGNAFLDADGHAGWLDFQVTQWGHWSIDVSYHLGTVLDIEDRRAHEEDLLRHYLDELGSNGVDAPSWDEAWERYALGFPWGFFLWVITTVSSREVVLVHIPRLGAALEDHDTFRRLGLS